MMRGATFKRPDLVNIVEASFEVALLIDKKGRVRHVNAAAEELFDIDATSTTTHIDALAIFETEECWKDVYKELTSQSYPTTWNIKCTKQNDSQVFPASIKLAKVSWKDGNDYVFGYLRTEEENDQKYSAHTKQFDSTVDPMMAIDQSGNILMFNQAAVESIDWCDPELVGRHISHGLTHPAFDRTSPDPIIRVDETGSITNINEAAIEDLSWLTSDLVGKNLLKMGDYVKEEGKVPIQPATVSTMSSWWSSSTQDTIEPRRKRSPEVLRIYLDALDASSEDQSTIGSRSGNQTFLSGNNSASEQQRDNIMWAIVEASLDPMFQINERGIIQMFNRAAVRQFGYAREEFLGNNISMIVGGGHAANHDKYLKRYLETGITKVIGQRRELSARRSDGTEFPIELAVVEVDTFQGDERLFCGFVHDLSSVKKKERITNDIVEASLDPMFLITESGIIRMVNKAAIRQFGFKKSELIGHNISIIVGGGHDKNHDQYLKDYITTGHTKVIGKLRQLLARRKDGSEFPIQLGVVEMKSSSDEERMFCGFVHDLTEVKSNERISRGIIESSLDAMFQIDDHGKIEMVNKAAVESFGWTKQEFMGKNIKMIVPMDHESSHDMYLKRFRDTGKMHLVGKRREVAARRKDGTEFPIEIMIAPIEDKYSGRMKFCGFLRNLSDVKKHQSNVLRRERLMTGMINSSLDAMFQIDHTGKILTVNTAASEVFGWAEFEFIGKNISMIVGKDHAPNHDQYLKRYLETGEKRVMGKKRQLSARRKDGSEIPIELSLTEVMTPEGRTFCGMVRDLSTLNQQADISRGLIDASMDPMFLIDSRGLIQMVNQAAVIHFGWEREEFTNSNIKMIVGGDHARYHDSYLKSYLDTGESGVIGKRRVLPGRRKDGSEFPIELAVVEVKRASGNFFCGYARVMNTDEGEAV